MSELVIADSYAKGDAFAYLSPQECKRVSDKFESFRANHVYGRLCLLDAEGITFRVIVTPEAGKITFELDDQEWYELPNDHEEFKGELMAIVSRFLARVHHWKHEAETEQYCNFEQAETDVVHIHWLGDGIIDEMDCDEDTGSEAEVEPIGTSASVRNIGSDFSNVGQADQAADAIQDFQKGYHEQLAILAERNKSRLGRNARKDEMTGSRREADDVESFASTHNSGDQSNSDDGIQEWTDCLLKDYDTQLKLLEEANKRRLKQRELEKTSGIHQRGGIDKRAHLGKPKTTRRVLSDSEVNAVTTGASIDALSLQETTGSGFSRYDRPPPTGQSTSSSSAPTDASAYTGTNL